MEIPKMFYGQQKEVRARTLKLVKQFEKGAPVESLDFGEMMDTFEVRDAGIWGRSDGYPLLLLDSSKPLGSHIDEFHCYAFFAEVFRLVVTRRSDDSRWNSRWEEAFGWSLHEPWRLLGVAGQSGKSFFYRANRTVAPNAPEDAVRGRPEWYGPYLRATLKSWDILEGEGPRYDFASQGRLFSMMPTTVLLVLGYLGAPVEPNPCYTPGRTIELLRAAVAKLDAEGVN
jgi:hypothetical protein